MQFKTTWITMICFLICFTRQQLIKSANIYYWVSQVYLSALSCSNDKWSRWILIAGAFHTYL